ncbi:MAG: hypothetical protein V4664_00135 [Patescibacteria group bacterium]
MRPSHIVKKGRRKESKERMALKKSLQSIALRCGLSPKARKKYVKRVLEGSDATARVLAHLNQAELYCLR